MKLSIVSNSYDTTSSYCTFGICSTDLFFQLSRSKLDQIPKATFYRLAYILPDRQKSNMPIFALRPQNHCTERICISHWHLQHTLAILSVWVDEQNLLTRKMGIENSTKAPKRCQQYRLHGASGNYHSSCFSKNVSKMHGGIQQQKLERRITKLICYINNEHWAIYKTANGKRQSSVEKKH